ncbi:aldose 1-epimerase [Rhodoferax sp.]|uniref:aldose 1-epimerase n=1 Tax=Rhodoferax sp. TaxID=50421 RepID=UPI002765E407|nr:aldose 1-epimerase [Rhodoferax sp.]
MNSSLLLASDDLRCEIAPALGGSVAGLWLGQVPVLRSTAAAALTSVRNAGSYPLVPFSNRVGHGSLRWAGTDHPLVVAESFEPHAIHGVGWLRPWIVLEASAQFALLSFEHQADESWPFAFDASQAFRLQGAELELTLSITNQSAVAAPVGLGWHPYFVKRADTHVRFAASGRWEMGDDKLPTRRALSAGLDRDCEGLDVDHCFDGWNGVLHLTDNQLHTTVTSSLRYVVVYTNATRNYVAIEPVSHVNNAINLLEQGRASASELGVCVLQPGESMSAQMSIHVERIQ